MRDLGCNSILGVLFCHKEIYAAGKLMYFFPLVNWDLGNSQCIICLYRSRQVGCSWYRVIRDFGCSRVMGVFVLSQCGLCCRKLMYLFLGESERKFLVHHMPSFTIKAGNWVRCCCCCCLENIVRVRIECATSRVLRNWVKLPELALALIYSLFCVQTDEPNKLPLTSKLLVLEARWVTHMNLNKIWRDA